MLLSSGAAIATPVRKLAGAFFTLLMALLYAPIYRLIAGGELAHGRRYLSFTGADLCQLGGLTGPRLSVQPL